MMSLFFAASGIGRVTGATSGGHHLAIHGMTTVCTLSALLNLGAFWALLWGLKGWVSDK